MSIYSVILEVDFSPSGCHFFEKLVSVSEYFLQYKSWFYWSSWLVMFGGRKKIMKWARSWGNDNTVTLIKSLGSDEAGDKIWCWFSPFENHEVSSFLPNCLRFHFSPGSLVEEIVFVELLLMTPPGRHMICGQGFGQVGKEPQFVVCLILYSLL